MCAPSETSSGLEDGREEDGVLTSKTCAKWTSTFSWVLVHTWYCLLWLNQHERGIILQVHTNALRPGQDEQQGCLASSTGREPGTWCWQGGPGTQAVSQPWG